MPQIGPANEGCDPTLPGQQLAIQAWRDDGKLIGTTIASLPREQAVGTACNSPHSAHGFVLVVQNDPSLLDNKWHDVRLVTAGPNSTVVPLNNSPVRIFFEGQPNNSLPPANPGDVVARDLDSQVFSDLGHIGIWDGSYVIEMLNGGINNNFVNMNSWEDFKLRQKTWDSIRVNYSDSHVIRSCWGAVCDFLPGNGHVYLPARQAVAQRAFQVFLIGASYTATALVVVAEPQMTEKPTSYRRPAVRGMYRCDTFVIDAFKTTTVLNNNVYHPIRSETNPPHGWANKISAMSNSAPIPNPRALYDLIRNL